MICWVVTGVNNLVVLGVFRSRWNADCAVRAFMRFKCLPLDIVAWTSGSHVVNRSFFWATAWSLITVPTVSWTSSWLKQMNFLKHQISQLESFENICNFYPLYLRPFSCSLPSLSLKASWFLPRHQAKNTLRSSLQSISSHPALFTPEARPQSIQAPYQPRHLPVTDRHLLKPDNLRLPRKQRQPSLD